MTDKSFNNFKHNGLHLKFPNGNSLSTIWGYGSYSENHDMFDDLKGEDQLKVYTTFKPSNTVEVAILSAPEELIKKIHKKYNFDGSVCGYLTMAQWLDIVKMLSK